MSTAVTKILYKYFSVTPTAVNNYVDLISTSEDAEKKSWFNGMV